MGRVKITREKVTELKRNKWAVNQLMIDGFNGYRFIPSPTVTQGFLLNLKEFDPDLEVWFNRIVDRWQLYWRGSKIMTFQYMDGGFRQLGSWVFPMLRKGDSRTRGDAWVDEILDENEKIQISDENSFRDGVKSLAPDVAKYVAKESEKDIGALNIPKEDLRVPDDDVLEKQRKNRLHPKNYRRRPMPYFDLKE